MSYRAEPGSLPQATWSPAGAIRLWPLLGRHYRMLIACMLAGPLVMLAVMVVQGPTYEVNAKLLLQLGREMLPPPFIGAKDSAQIMPVAFRPEDTASEIELLTDPNLIQSVVQSFDPAFFLAEPPAITLMQHLRAMLRAAQHAVSDGIRGSLVLLGLRPPTTPIERVTLGLQSAIEVEAVRRSDVIALKIGTPDPEAGVMILDRFISLAAARHREIHTREDELPLMVAERDARRNDLAAEQTKLLAIQSQAFAAWLAPEQRSLLLRTVADLQLQQAQSLADAAQTAAEIGSLEHSVAAMPDQVQTSSVQTRNALGDDLQRRRLQLQLDLVGLRERYAPESPDIAEAQHQIEAIGTALAAQPGFQVTQVTTGEDPQRAEVLRQLRAKQSLLAGLNARAGQLAARLDALQQELRSVQQAGLDVDRLERGITRLQRLIDLYQGAIDDARLSQAMKAASLSNLKVIMPPTAERMPVRPSLKRYLLLGLAGGLLLATAAVLLRDYAGVMHRTPAAAPARKDFATVETR